jgi:hypothetical protein
VFLVAESARDKFLGLLSDVVFTQPAFTSSPFVAIHLASQFLLKTSMCLLDRRSHKLSEKECVGVADISPGNLLALE